MMIPADFLEMLRCPQSGQGLAWADAELLQRVNARTEAKATTAGPLTEALVRLDRLVLYPVRDGIPVLLAEEAIPL